MNQKSFIIYGTLIATLMGASFGYAISTGNVLLLITAFAAGTIIFSLLRRRVVEIIEDERTRKISEKASERTLQIFGTGMAMMGVFLIAVRKFTEVGIALALMTWILILLYVLFCGYYSRKALD